jgi:hypothetical protein
MRLARIEEEAKAKELDEALEVRANVQVTMFMPANLGSQTW